METSSRKMWYQEKVMSYWKNQNDCMEKARGAIMVLAVYTLIIFPRMAENFKRKVEDRTLDSSEEQAYFYFKMSSSFTSIASLLMTLLLLTGFLVKSRVCTGLLSIVYLVTLLSMIPGYSSSMYLVTPSQLHERLYLAHCVLLITAAAGALLCVFHTICFLTWLSVREKMEGPGFFPVASATGHVRWRTRVNQSLTFEPLSTPFTVLLLHLVLLFFISFFISFGLS